MYSGSNFNFPGCPDKIVITKVITGPSLIRICWKRAKDEQKRSLYIELKYKPEPLEEWKIRMMLPTQQTFLLIDLPSRTTVYFELRAVGYNGVFGPVTKVEAKTKGK